MLSQAGPELMISMRVLFKLDTFLLWNIQFVSSKAEEFLEDDGSVADYNSKGRTRNNIVIPADNTNNMRVVICRATTIDTSIVTTRVVTRIPP